MLRLNLMQRAESNARAASIKKNPEEPDGYKESADWELATDSDYALLDGGLHQVSGWWELAIVGPSMQLTLHQNPLDMSKDQRMLRYSYQAGSGWNVGSAEVKGVQPVAIRSVAVEEQPPAPSEEHLLEPTEEQQQTESPQPTEEEIEQ